MLYHIKESIVPISFCDEVIKQGENKEISKAKIQEGNKANRSSDVSWLDEEKLGTSLTNLVIIANKESGWNYSLKEFEPLQYTIYKKDDFYDWHIDSHNNPYDNGMVRKLSFTLCLNDEYTGGELEICEPHPDPKKTKFHKFDKITPGTMIIFYSGLWHRVLPVKTGFRKSLVGWTLGTKFQ